METTLTTREVEILTWLAGCVNAHTINGGKKAVLHGLERKGLAVSKVYGFTAGHGMGCRWNITDAGRLVLA